ncbi:zinc dependent phospholipase C family protein [Pontibacter pamirensis]|uniref:zinc dependent phospholipase C family protein n=1 Tax=Pontibacter pamirensis TaxID=2562824 RepID=UPI00138A2200|nr:zinc dependent phospholipase C family protein [Pontibacter pamirensis]
MLLTTAPAANSYGILAHQAVIDAAWEKSLKPLLLRRFPDATEEELQKAHAFAYGGSIVQDMGYYPFGSVFFTNLTHYVRSGDFVLNMVKASETLNEYAFALGTMAHFNADIYGHPIGTNQAVALVYPEVREEHGDTVTYEENPIAHIKTEFGFDVLQVARGGFAPEAYMNFIGFEVSEEVLKQAFVETYGLELNKVFLDLPLAIGSYRYTVRNLFPRLTKAAWQAKKSDIQEAQPGVTRRKFVYRMSRAKYHENWGGDYERPGFFTRILSCIIRMLPKIGPLRPLAFKPPTPEAEELFLKSFNTTVDNYIIMLNQGGQGEHTLENMQLDTGKPIAPGQYELTDETYAELLEELADTGFKHVTPALQTHLLQFYKKARAPHQKKEIEDWEETQEQLARLAAMEL